MGTGGMSHQLQGKRFGFMNEKFDQWFLDQLETDPEALAQLSHHEIMEEAGAEAVELIMWLTMRGALSPKAKRVHRHYYAPMTTGMGLITFETTRNSDRRCSCRRSAPSSVTTNSRRAGASRMIRRRMPTGRGARPLFGDLPSRRSAAEESKWRDTGRRVSVTIARGRRARRPSARRRPSFSGLAALARHRRRWHRAPRSSARQVCRSAAISSASW